MAKIKNATKNYQPNYQDLIKEAMQKKYQYFLIGFTLLILIIVGFSYLLLKKTPEFIKNNNLLPQVVSPEVFKTMPSITQTTSATPKIIKPQTAAVTPQEQTTAPAGMQKEVRNYTTYIVKAGDNLWKIAEQAYKSGYNFVDVVRFNNIQNPGHIEVGQTILLPTVTPMPPTTPKEIVTTKGGQIEVGQTSSTMTSHVTFTGTSYTVQKGDTLWSISEKAYGDGFAWHMIERANSITNPTSLEIGTKLKIPRS